MATPELYNQINGNQQFLHEQWHEAIRHSFITYQLKWNSSLYLLSINSHLFSSSGTSLGFLGGADFSLTREEIVKLIEQLNKAIGN